VVREIIRVRPSLGSLLSRSRLGGIEGDVITVELPPRNRFGLEQLGQPENLQVIQDLLRDMTGKSVTLAYVLAAPDASHDADGGSSVEVRRGPRQPDEGVKRVLEIFDGRELFPDPESESDAGSEPERA
jgi:hypothetical protein